VKQQMGMRGYYFAVDDDFVQEAIDNPMDLLERIAPDAPSIEIGKAWQAIHFLLCGVSYGGEPPLGDVVPLRSENALDIEEPVCDVQMFALTNRQVQEAYHSIKDMGKQELRAKYHPKSFAENEIYYAWADDEEPFFEYLYDNFRYIQDFYKEASEHNRGMIFRVR